MKKFLSLVLALVMTMSLVTIGAGATFEDDATINYVEAVEVMKAIDVIDGYDNGTFRPANTLTRQAAAKIICNLILGPTTADELTATVAPYSDVATDSQFAGYIAYCKQTGIIAGYADGTFRPTGTLNGYAFMKMLLGALEFDQNKEGYVGENWKVNVAKQALGLGLDKGLKGAFDGNKAVTREEACLYALNMIQQNIVKYGLLGVQGATPTFQKFMDKYFDDLEKETEYDADDWGRPSVSNFKLEGKSIVFVPMQPVATYNKAAEECDIAKDLKLKATDDPINMKEVYYNGDPEATPDWENNTSDTEVDPTETEETFGAQGQIVEIYKGQMTDNGKKGDYRMVVIDTFLAKVESVDEIVYDHNKHVDEPAAIEFTVYADEDDDVQDVLSDEGTITLTSKKSNFKYEEGDMILVHVNVNDVDATEIIGKADSKVGTQTRIFKTDDKHEINDKVYMDAYKYVLDEAEDDGSVKFTWFFDQFGNVIGSEAIETEYNYGIISYIERHEQTRKDDTIIADIVFVDGTKKTDVEIKAMNDDEGEIDLDKEIDTNWKNNEEFVAAHLYKIAVDKNGKYTLTVVADDNDVHTEEEDVTIENKNPNIDGLDEVKIDSKTVFLIRSGADFKKFTFKSVTGMKNIDTFSEVEIDYVAKDNGYAKFVYIIGDPDAATTYDYIVMRDREAAWSLKTDAKGVEYYTVTGSYDVNGKSAPVKVEKEVEETAKIVETLTAAESKGMMFLVKYVDGYAVKIADVTGNDYATLLEEAQDAVKDFQEVIYAEGSKANVYNKDNKTLALDGEADVFNVEDAVVLTPSMEKKDASYLTVKRALNYLNKADETVYMGVYLVLDADSDFMATNVIITKAESMCNVEQA